MVRSLTFRVSVLAVVVALALTGLAWLLVDASDRTNESFGSVTRSAEIIEAMDQALIELGNAESGQRGFVLTRNPVFAQFFEDCVSGSRAGIARVVELTAGNPTQDMRAQEIRSLIDRRIDILREPLNLARLGQFEEARDVIAQGKSRDLMTAVTAHAQAFLQTERAWQRSRIDAAGHRLGQVKQLALVGGPIIAILKLLVSGFIIRGIRQPVRVIHSAMADLGRGNRRARISSKMGSIEFEQLAQGYNAMAERLEGAIADQSRSERELQEVNETLRQRGEVIELLGAMAHRMQAARNDDELAKVIRVFVPRVLPGIDGGLYTFDESRNLLVPVTGWGGHVAQVAFRPDQCWALRRGQSHSVSSPGCDIVCEHVAEEGTVYHCEPLLAGGELIGTLYLHGVLEAEHRFRLAVMVENIASALVNHRLQRGLREQTIRDPLTGLHNRRYMEETLRAEIARTFRSGEPLSLVMCDIDHFKRFNDEFGHDAGDVVLRAVANEMRSRFRSEDVVCRFGGEEFTVIAPGIGPTDLSERVESVRRAIADLEVRYRDRRLGQTCMSFGIASWTEEMDRNGQALVQAADAALYQAKRDGRNRTILSLEHAA